MKKLFVHAAAASLIAGGAFALTTAPASAYVACNRSGECWHTAEHYDYQPHFGVVVHDDNWRWHDRHHRWHEHDGRGYWRNGLWVTF